MTKQAFDQIAEGLKEAIAVANGTAEPAFWHKAVEIDVKAIRNQKMMKFDAIVHKAEEGGYWAEIPAVPGCVSQGETMEELIANLREAINDRLSAPVLDDRRAEGL
jgi:predicted RNase H-like HicB family nuclease